MALKTLIGEKIMEDVIRQVKHVEGWKILVLDRLSVRIISSCCKMKDIIDEGITLVEDLFKVRQPMPTFDAVYFITPSRKSIEQVIDDFADGRKYKFAHIFFTDSCPDHLFRSLCQNRIARYITTAKEVNIAFLPYESQVFTLDCPGSFELIYSPHHISTRHTVLERIAEQLSTLCAVLGEYPSVRFRQDGDKSVLLAQLLQTKLDAFKVVNADMGMGPDKSRSQLIILDRGFDLVSVILHELTYQAMVQDLLPVENDVYQYESQQAQGRSEKQVLLDEDDELWVSFRHEHIADVAQKVTSHLKAFAKEKRLGTAEKTTLRDLSNMLKKMPQYQKELSKYATHLHMAEDCMKHYTDRVDKLCKVEQDLAMGTDVSGTHIKEPMKSVIHILLDGSIPSSDKIRIILLYVLLRNGVPDDSLKKLFMHGQISEQERLAVDNMQHLGVNITTSVPVGGKKRAKLERRERNAKYQLSRWTPVVKDVMEMAIEDKLDQRLYPFLSGRGAGSIVSAARSARYHWHKDKGTSEYKSGPRLIIFIIGGMSCSEMRCAYEVTNNLRAKGNKWEVLIGSTCMLKPVTLLDDVRRLDGSQKKIVSDITDTISTNSQTTVKLDPMV